jgi:hypothetical protein
MNLIKRVFVCLTLTACIAFSAVTAAETEEPDPMAQRLADAQTAIDLMQAGRYGMVPIYGMDIADGTYEIHVDSSSPYFRISKCILTVKDGEMTARFTIPSMSYRYVYPGTKKQASDADPSTWIEFEEEDHQTTFTFPVPALNTQLECAAYSKGRRRWYSRKLVFEAASLPKEALSFELPDYELIEQAIRSYEVVGSEVLRKQREAAAAAVQAVNLEMDDGEYSIEVNMTGGSGRASISSPTLLIIRGGKAFARLIWSSVYYDYMILEGGYFYNLTDDGGPSCFEIPITKMDEPIQVIADTTAMGEPVEIQYTLTFYAETVGEKGQIPQESAKLVLMIAAAIIAGGGVLDHIVKKKRGG